MAKNSEFEFLDNYYKFFIAKNPAKDFAAISKKALVETNQISQTILDSFLEKKDTETIIASKNKQIETLNTEIRLLRTKLVTLENKLTPTSNNSSCGSSRIEVDDNCGRSTIRHEPVDDGCGHSSRRASGTC